MKLLKLKFSTLTSPDTSATRVAVWRRALYCVAEQDRCELNLRTLKAAEADDFMPSPAVVLHVDKD